MVLPDRACMHAVSTHALVADNSLTAAVVAVATPATAVVRRVGAVLPAHCRRVGHVDAVPQQAPHRYAARRARSAHGGHRSAAPPPPPPPPSTRHVCHLLTSSPSLLCADAGAEGQNVQRALRTPTVRACWAT